MTSAQPSGAKDALFYQLLVEGTPNVQHENRWNLWFIPYYYTVCKSSTGPVLL